MAFRQRRAGRAEAQQWSSNGSNGRYSGSLASGSRGSSSVGAPERQVAACEAICWRAAGIAGLVHVSMQHAQCGAALSSSFRLGQHQRGTAKAPASQLCCKPYSSGKTWRRLLASGSKQQHMDLAAHVNQQAECASRGSERSQLLLFTQCSNAVAELTARRKPAAAAGSRSACSTCSKQCTRCTLVG